MAKDKDNEGLDDLFEPFELDEFPTDAESASTEALPLAPLPPPPMAEPGDDPSEPPPPTVRCPSCGSGNPAHNRHCEECGARLSKEALPVAPPPMIRSTPGGRALGILLAVLAIVALFALFLNIFRGGDDTVAQESTTSSSSTTQVATQTELGPASVEASSSFPGLDPERLIDGDTSTYWNDNSQKGVGATLVFTFAQPVAISEMEMQNIIDAIAFKRNYRIKDFQVTVDDLAIELPYTMPDNNEPYRVPLNTLETRRLTITVLETYPGEPVGDDPSFTELAVSEVRFFGSVTN